MKTKSIVGSIVAAVLSLALCVGMLVGTTFAWFSDSVSSTGNRIAAGTLSVELNDGSTEALFASDAEWQPGTSERKTVKIENTGSLALRYRISAVIREMTGENDLSEGLSVYAAEVGGEERTYLGKLATLAAENIFDDDNLLEGGDSRTFDLIIELPAEAGNEYQGCGIAFDLQISAIQATEGAQFASLWTGEADTSWYSEEEEQFDIASADQLAGLASIVTEGNNFNGKTVTLVSDFDFGGREFPVIAAGSSYTRGFRGTLEGNGKTVSNYSVTSDSENPYSGLFGSIYYGTVRDLELSNAVIENDGSASGSAQASAGALAGVIYNSTVENVRVTGESSVTASIRSGGVIGAVRGTSSVVSGCVNEAAVNVSNQYSGGIVGAIHFGSNSRVTGCINYGTVNGRTEVGGIAGYADRAYIENCENYGDVTGTGVYGTGGILGQDACNRQLFYPQNGSTIVGCGNYGTITAPGHVGGILGTFAMTPGDPQPTSRIYSTIENCVNNGAVVGNGGATEAAKAGAIFGYQHTYAKGDADENINNLYVRMVGCSNTGTVNGEVPSGLTASAFTETE